jgi:hypothetical protein
MLIYHLKGKPTHTLATDGSNDSDLTKLNSNYLDMSTTKGATCTVADMFV